MTPPPVLILPGYDNSGPEHWQSLWQQAHPDYRRVEQRDWTAPVCDEWVAALDRAVLAAPAPPLLVAHSIGCHTVVHHFARHRRTVHGALLVAPPDVDDPDFPPVIEGFRPVPRGRLPFPSIVVSSSDDWYIAPEAARAFAEAWGSRFVLLERAGHINTDAGFGPWPEGERLLAELMA